MTLLDGSWSSILTSCAPYSHHSLKPDFSGEVSAQSPLKFGRLRCVCLCVIAREMLNLSSGELRDAAVSSAGRVNNTSHFCYAIRQEEVSKVVVF